MLGRFWAMLGLSDSRINLLSDSLPRDCDSLSIPWITSTGAGASIFVGAWAVAWAVGWVGWNIGWWFAVSFSLRLGLWLGLWLGLGFSFAAVLFLWLVRVLVILWWTIWFHSSSDSLSVCFVDVWLIYLHNNDLVFLAFIRVFVDAFETLVAMTLGLIVVVVASGFVVRSCGSKASHCCSEGKEDE